MKLRLFNNKLRFLVQIFLMSIVTGLFAQSQKTIYGKVLSSEDNLPLPGATILVKGTSNGASTDFDGKFSLQVNSNTATLIVSYLGYKTKNISLFKANGKPIVITLHIKENSLSEVVVVGYGTQKKSVVTGAISTVKSKDIDRLPNGRIERALQGQTSGVVIASNSGQPGSASTIRIRGITTFNTYGGNNPLWVVDGVIVDAGGIGYINQSDIKSIEVLKDAASLAIYGARSASGVILVTTKKGKAGKINVNYSGYEGVSSPAKILKLLNATEYGALMNEKSVAGGGPVLFSDLSSLGVGTDWQKAIFNNSAQLSSHEISVSGGNDISTFFISFGLRDEEGIVATDISHFNKKNIRINSTHKLSKYITIGQTLGYAHKKQIGIGNTNSEFGGPLSSAINLDPITPLVVTDPVVANATPYSNNSVLRDESGNPYGISSLVGQEMTNPLAFTKTRLDNYSWSDDFVGNVFVELKPIKGLKIRSTLGTKLAYWGYRGFTPEYYLNASTNTTQNNLSRNINKTFAWNIENTISYVKKYKKHNFFLLLGQGAYVDNISSGSSLTYFNLPVTNYEDASFNFNIPSSQISGGAYEGIKHNVTSLFARLNYNYNEKYLFTGVIRRDGSSRFGLNKRYGVFPAFSLGWAVHKEAFWKKNNIINQLKIRGGYGITGNDGIPDFGYLALVNGGRNYTFGQSGTDILTGYSPNAPDNPNLHWEQTSQTNIGFDTRLFNYFNFSFDYYKKTTTGILQYNEIPGFVGATGSPLGNVADMQNSGIEFELGYHKKFGKLNFSAKGNLSYLKNEVTFLGDGKEFITTGVAGFQSMGAITRTEVGEPYNSFFGFQTDGIFQNMNEVNAYTNSSGDLIQPDAKPGDFRWVDTNGDGVISDDDKKVLGNPYPKYTFGLTFNLDYENFDLMVFTQGVSGNKIFQGLRRLDIINANYQTIALSRWTSDGSTNNFPRLINGDPNGNFSKPSNFYLENGDYLRFKTIQLGYTLPKSLIKPIGAQKLRLFITGENLITLTNYTGYDPEIGGNVLGIDRGYYPQAKTFMFGASIQF